MKKFEVMAARYAALGEPTRLRLLSACRDQPLLVSEFARSLALPMPAVSRHLAVLAAAGLLNKERRGREVFYAWSNDAIAMLAPSAEIAALAAADATLRRDARQAHSIAAVRGRADFEDDSAFGERMVVALRSLADELGSLSALGIEIVHGPLLVWLQASTASLQLSTRSQARRRATAAFARAHAIPLEWLADPTDANDAAQASRTEREIGLVCIEAASAAELAVLLESAARHLVSGGRLLLGLPYDSLEGPGAQGAHPLFRLRALLTERGFDCERLLPLEAAGEHWLLASGSRKAQTQRAMSGREG